MSDGTGQQSAGNASPRRSRRLRIAQETFAAPKRVVHAGEMVPDDDPVIKGREHLFSAPMEPVEDTTARPGPAARETTRRRTRG